MVSWAKRTIENLVAVGVLAILKLLVMLRERIICPPNMASQ